MSDTQADAVDLPNLEELKAKRAEDLLRYRWLYFGNAFDHRAADVHANSVAHGWWEQDRNDGEMIALMHAELSEALEALRDGNPPDAKLPEFGAVEVELADAVIRIMDMAAARGYRVGAAIVAKHEYNKTRPHKHGGKVF